MEWKCDIAYIREGYDRAIIDVDTERVIAVVSNLDSKFINHIVNEHNKSISLARKEGTVIAKEVYRLNK